MIFGIPILAIVIGFGLAALVGLFIIIDGIVGPTPPPPRTVSLGPVTVIEVRNSGGNPELDYAVAQEFEGHTDVIETEAAIYFVSSGPYAGLRGTMTQLREKIGDCEIHIDYSQIKVTGSNVETPASVFWEQADKNRRLYH